MFTCVRCFDQPVRRAPEAWLPKVGGVCLEHLVDAWRDEQLCIRCRSWVATTGPLCDSCAEEVNQ